MSAFAGAVILPAMVGADEAAGFHEALGQRGVAVGTAIHGGMGDPLRIAP
jgi:uncharacterized protein related to proFAR isomerase